MLSYVRDPAEIYRQSFAEIEQIAALDRLAPDIRKVAIRLIHSCGMPDILDDLRFSDDVVEATTKALNAGADIYCDVDTLRYGIMQRLLPTDCQMHCAIAEPQTAETAKAEGMTRAASQIDLWGDRLAGQILVIGNAPTTLFRMLERVDVGAATPAVIVAFPVGFVGAAESKAELAADSRGIPFITLLGKRGGSGMAQAAMNGLAGGLGT